MPAFQQNATFSIPMSTTAFRRSVVLAHDDLDTTATGVMLSGDVNGVAKVEEFARMLGATVVSSVPAPGSDYGLYHVTGAGKGVYFSNGNETVEWFLIP